jgi:hypothetical protein
VFQSSVQLEVEPLLLGHYASTLVQNVRRREQHTQAFLGWQGTAAQQQPQL